jgi:L-lactate dehydrogenase
MKVAIIGGGGRVGSCAAFRAAMLGNREGNRPARRQPGGAEGEALDLLHGAAFCADQDISAGHYSDCAKADIICITAGLRRKPDESRLDLINRNVTLFVGILQSLKGKPA